MARKGIKRNILIRDHQQEKRWDEHEKECGFPSFSLMVLFYVDKGMIERETTKDPLVGALEPLKDSLAALHKQNESFSASVELISMRLAKEGAGSEVSKAASECLSLLVKHPAKDCSEIAGTLSYTDETICVDLALLIEMDLIGYKNNKPEETEEKHEKK